MLSNVEVGSHAPTPRLVHSYQFPISKLCVNGISLALEVPVTHTIETLGCCTSYLEALGGARAGCTCWPPYLCLERLLRSLLLLYFPPSLPRVLCDESST